MRHLAAATATVIAIVVVVVADAAVAAPVSHVAGLGDTGESRQDWLSLAFPLRTSRSGSFHCTNELEYLTS